MPELPEVETFVRQLQPITGASIQSADVADARLELDASALAGTTISSVERRGKYILLRLADHGDLAIHLRMSGRLRLHRAEREVAYTRLTLHLNTGDSIYFVNPRRLGTAVHYPDGFVMDMGLEPLSPRFTVDALRKIAHASRSPIKMLLLDQRKIAGIGNIYAAEALWRSGISPHRVSNSLSLEETKRLHTTLLSVLTEAIAGQGTSLGNGVSDYHPAGEEQGEFQNHLSVYGREAEPCERCGTAIARIRQGGRSTYYCTNCQD
jgi:formamidopyrimidine-DNA glycosylase